MNKKVLYYIVLFFCLVFLVLGLSYLFQARPARGIPYLIAFAVFAVMIRLMNPSVFPEKYDPFNQKMNEGKMDSVWQGSLAKGLLICAVVVIALILIWLLLF